jgi:hypothetical protein
MDMIEPCNSGAGVLAVDEMYLIPYQPYKGRNQIFGNSPVLRNLFNPSVSIVLKRTVPHSPWREERIGRANIEAAK